MRNSVNYKKVLKSCSQGIIMSFLCVGLLVLFSIGNKNLKEKLSFEEDDEIILGDWSCTDWTGGSWSSWSCNEGGSTTSEPNSSTTGTRYTQYDKINDSSEKACKQYGGVSNCKKCSRSKTWTRTCRETSSCCCTKDKTACDWLSSCTGTKTNKIAGANKDNCSSNVVTYSCSLNYDKSKNTVSISGKASDGNSVTSSTINSQQTSSMSVVKSGNFTGKVWFQSGATAECSAYVEKTGTSCNYGQYLNENGCHKCEKGYYCKGDIRTACPANSTTDGEGSVYISSCKCNDGLQMVDGACRSCKVNGLTFNADHVSSGSSFSGKIDVENCTKDQLTIDETNTKCSFGVTTKYAIIINCTAGAECTKMKVTVSSKNANGGSATAEIKAGDVKTTWDYQGRASGKGLRKSQRYADQAGEDVYATNCDDNEICDIYSRSSCGMSNVTLLQSYCCVNSDKSDYIWKKDQAKIECSSGYTRDSSINTEERCQNPACYERSSGELVWTNDINAGTKTTKTKAQCKNCYMNASTWSASTGANYLSEPNATYNFFAKGKTESQCKILPSVTFCEPATTSITKDEKNTSSCEQTVTSTFKDGKKCTGESYYKIECDNKVIATFDNNDDSSYGNKVGKTNTLVPGQGFAFGVTLTVQRTCTGTFDGTKWKNDYNALVSSLSHLQKQEDINWVNNQINDLKEFVNDYNEYDNSATNDFGGKFSLTYKTDDGDKPLSTEFTSSVIDKGTGKYTKSTTVSLGVSGVTNPKNYTWTNSSKPKKIKLAFPQVYIDAATGAVTTKEKGVDGGNRLFINDNAVAGTYPMSLEIYSPDSGSSIIKITNNKCDIKVETQKIVYRPISVSNPFINDSREKGKNWVNDTFDFTGIIHANTWSGTPLYDIKLTSNDIKNIKENNSKYLKSGYAPYLGMCRVLSKDEISRDAVAKKLCDTFK